MFDQYKTEVRRFAKTQIADVLDSREPQLLAGIVSNLRVINGQRGRVALFQLDDGSEAMEAVVNEELLQKTRDVLKDDELVLVMAKAQADRFSGGVRLNVVQVWDLVEARCRFGKHLRLRVDHEAPSLISIVARFPPRKESTDMGVLLRGLSVRVQLERPQLTAEIDLGEDARFTPSEEALQAWQQLLQRPDAVEIVY